MRIRGYLPCEPTGFQPKLITRSFGKLRAPLGHGGSSRGPNDLTGMRDEHPVRREELQPALALALFVYGDPGARRPRCLPARRLISRI